MQIRPLSIDGAWVFTPRQHGDRRGTFLEAFKADEVSELIGGAFNLAQVNVSVSAAGVLRGIHFTDMPPGQAKYVMCLSGSVVDVVVDLRLGSPTFGQYEAVILDDVDHRAVYVSEGLGHGFCATVDNSTVTYLCSLGYRPDIDRGIHPCDPEVGIEWPTHGPDGPLTLTLSDKDASAPSLAQARTQGILPDHMVVQTSIAGERR